MPARKTKSNVRLNDYLKLSKSILTKPLAHAESALGVTMAIGVLGALQSVDAQVVYSGVQNVACNLAANTNRCYANIDLAGGNDFEIHRNHAAGNVFIQADEVAGGGFEINGFYGNAAGGYAYPDALNAGVVIGAAGPWVFGTGQANTMQELNNAYPGDKWTALATGTTRFLGIRSSAPVRYGWIRVTVNGFGNLTIVDWAYNNTPNTPITTGITTAADLTISGRVLTANGRGLSGAIVRVTETSGRVLTAVTTSRGLYQFDGLESGQSVVISVASRKFQYEPRVLNLNDSLQDIDFTPIDSTLRR